MGTGSWLRFEFELFSYSPREWLLVTGDRRLVTLLLVSVLGTLSLATMLTGFVPLRSETPILFLLFALIAANFTLIAIVTSLGQFVLSRRLESPGEIRRKINENIAYREDVSGTVGVDVTPVTPDGFFRILYQNVTEELTTIERRFSEGRTKQAREELRELVDGLTEHAEFVVGLLDRPSAGLKHALFTSLSADYEQYAHRTWHLQTDHSGEFTERLEDPLAQLIETIEHIEVASRAFKTVFIESEVAELARYLLYVGLPVQILAVLVMLLYTASGTQPTVTQETLQVLIPGVIVGGFTPFLLLCSYVVRLTVVARRTADNFPFTSTLDRTRYDT